MIRLCGTERSTRTASGYFSRIGGDEAHAETRAPAGLGKSFGKPSAFIFHRQQHDIVGAPPASTRTVPRPYFSAFGHQFGGH